MVKFEIKGIDLAIKGIKRKESQINKDVMDELNEWAGTSTKLAKDKAPLDEGHLRGSINAKYATLSNMSAGVTVQANYAAYIEFGTRKFAASYVSSLPQDWARMAAEYKGNAGGGDIWEFLLRLTQWVRRKGLAGTYSVKTQRRTGKKKDFANEDFDVAFAIALSILKKGIKPQPFLYPAYIETKDKLIENIKNVINK